MASQEELVTASKKKKKKKKKKKRSEEGGEAAATTTGDDVVEDGDEPAMEAPLSPKTVTTTEVHSQEKNTHEDTIAIAPNNDQVTESEMATKQHSKRIRQDHLDEFVDYVLGNSFDQLDTSRLVHLPLLIPRLQAIHIPHSTFLQVIEAINCQNCRQDVAHFLSEHQEVTLGQKIPVTFDYVAMEEGTLPRDHGKSSPWKMELFEPEKGDAYWKLVTTWETDGECLQTFADLAHDYLIGRGLSQDERFETMGYTVFHMQADLIESIKDSVHAKCRQMYMCMTGISQDLERKVSEWRETEVLDESNIELQTFPKLKIVDEGLDSIIQDVRRHAILPLTKAHFVTTSKLPRAGRDALLHEQELNTKVQSLWIAFIECIQSCVEHVAWYEELLFQLANRHGVLPKVFFSSTTRQLYRSFIRKKIGSVNQFISSVDSIANAEVESGILDLSGQTKTVLKIKLFTRQVFCDVLDQVHKVAPNDLYDEADEAWDRFIDQLCQCSRTVHKPNVEKTLTEHDIRREQLRSALHDAIKIVEQSSSQVLPEDHSTIDWNENDLPPQVCVLRFVEKMGLSQPLEVFRSDFLVGAVMSVKVWLDMRLSGRPTSEEAMKANFQMSHRLLQTTVQDGEDALAPCYGGKEENRAACILVGLLFQSLSSLCNEWRAEIAEQELLVTMTIDQNGKAGIESQTNANSKSKKKTKKKKDKKPLDVDIQNECDGVGPKNDEVDGLTNNDPQAIAVANSTVTGDLATDATATHVQGCSADLGIPGESVDVTDENDIPVIVPSSTGGPEALGAATSHETTPLCHDTSANETTSCKNSGNVEKGGIGSKHRATAIETEANETPAFETSCIVGVVHRKGRFVAAEDFLLARLKLVWDDVTS
jgi:hypothetical protein